MRSFLLSLAALAMASAGLFAAAVVAPARATTVSLGDLPGLGYSLALRADLSSSPPCSMYWVVGGNGAPETLIGDPNHLACTTPEELQARIDGLLAAYPPAPATTAALPTVTETVHDTTTEAVTTTLPAETTTITNTETLPVTTTVTTTETSPVETVTLTLPRETTTEPAPPAETVTIAAEPIVRTETVTVPQTQTETVTQTVTVQAPPPIPDWLRALALRSQALNDLYAL